MRRYALDGRTLGDGELGYPIGVNLPGSIWCIVAVPVLGLPFGAIGAAVGLRCRGTRARRPPVPEIRPS
jgi:hypothetical protein